MKIAAFSSAYDTEETYMWEKRMYFDDDLGIIGMQVSLLIFRWRKWKLRIWQFQPKFTPKVACQWIQA